LRVIGSLEQLPEFREKPFRSVTEFSKRHFPRGLVVRVPSEVRDDGVLHEGSHGSCFSQ
jgi:hypothetical protein